MDHKELWKAAFGDTDQYISYYFKEKAGRSRVYSKYAGGALVSMMFFTPYEVMYRGKECVCPYIVGVATEASCRRRGYMRMLLEQGLMEAEERGCELAFLCPADEKFYEPFGFRGVQYRKQLVVSGCGCARGRYEVSRFPELTGDEKTQAAGFAADLLASSGLDLYMKRSTAYYESVQKEMAALDGSVLVLWENSRIRGIAAYTYEEGQYDVTELVCAVSDGQNAVESICHFLANGSAEQIMFSDGQFLDQVEGAGIVRKIEQKPSIMIRELAEPRGAEPLRVYINDIT